MSEKFPSETKTPKQKTKKTNRQTKILNSFGNID